MKKRAQHPLAEVTRGRAKFEMTIGYRSWRRLEHYCKLNRNGDVVDQGPLPDHTEGHQEVVLSMLLRQALPWRLARIRSGSANNCRNSAMSCSWRTYASSEPSRSQALRELNKRHNPVPVPLFADSAQAGHIQRRPGAGRYIEPISHGCRN